LDLSPLPEEKTLEQLSNLIRLGQVRIADKDD
jgi:hypothetical protein